MYLIKCLHFLKFMAKFYAVCPLKKDTKRIWSLIYDFLWWFYFVNCVIATFVEIFTCYYAGQDFTTASFAFMESVSIIEAIIVLINYKRNYFVMQYLLTNTEEYITTDDLRKQSFLNEKAVVFAVIMSCITILYLILVVLYFTNPAVTAWDSLLTTVYYPPSIRSPYFDIVLYFHQIVVMIYTSVMVNVDATIVLLIYVSAVRFKVLAADFQAIKHREGLNKCIREHQYLLKIGAKTNEASRMVVAKTVICFIGYTVGAGLQIINPNAPLSTLQRFGVVVLLNYLRLIMCAISADYLSSVSNDLAFSVYSTDWYKEDRGTKLTKIIIMLRCEKVLKIYVTGIMPALNLPFITGIISTSISYFTTLRAITNT